MRIIRTISTVIIMFVAVLCFSQTVEVSKTSIARWKKIETRVEIDGHGRFSSTYKNPLSDAIVYMYRNGYVLVKGKRTHWKSTNEVFVFKNVNRKTKIQAAIIDERTIATGLAARSTKTTVKVSKSDNQLSTDYFSTEQAKRSLENLGYELVLKHESGGGQVTYIYIKERLY